MIAIAIGQALFPRLAKLYAARQIQAFRRLTLRAVGIGLGLGVAGTLIAMFLGKTILGLVYRPEYAEAHLLLTGMMGAASILFAVTLLGYAATAAKSFISQALLMTGVVIAIIVASAYFVPRFGLWGAVISVAIGNTVYIVGMVIIVTGLIEHIRMPEPQAAIVTTAAS
jgi:O-antigen/teichoic acid export membrane protein